MLMVSLKISNLDYQRIYMAVSFQNEPLQSAVHIYNFLTENPRPTLSEINVDIGDISRDMKDTQQAVKQIELDYQVILSREHGKRRQCNIFSFNYPTMILV